MIKKLKDEVFKLNQEKGQLKNQIAYIQIVRDENDTDNEEDPYKKKFLK